MAIYHCSVKIIGRNAGRSAVAAAAYRSAECLINEYDGIEHDFTKKNWVDFTEIILPENAPEEYQDRSTLWNAVELVEKSKDTELIRLNKAIVEMDVQIARALTLHQLLGTRISETLSLKQNAVRLGETGRWLIRIDQVKSRRSYEKVINGDVKALFDKACSCTNEKFGKQEYVFVNEKNPVDAMQYGRIQYQIMAMITKNNLTDDNGEKFGVGTHIFRHCYGKKLTEMHVDDVTIAKLLGHSNTSNVKYYRQIGDEMLSRETKQMRDAMDDVLRNIIGDWNDW